MNTVPSRRIEKDVFTMSVTKPNNVPNHRPHCGGMRICHSSAKPCSWFRECCQEPLVENWGKHRKDFSLQHLILRYFSIAYIIYLLDLSICRPIKVPTSNVDVLKNMPKAASIGHPFY